MEMFEFENGIDYMGKLGGLYIVSETGALKPTSGAGLHIRVGIEQLGKYFSIKKLLFCKPFHELPVTAEIQKSSLKKDNKLKIISECKKMVKWVYLIVRNHLPFFIYFKRIQKASPSFIYERAGYLNYNGLLISKLLNIPHIYEVNGIAAYDHKKYFPAFCNRISFWLEKKAYTRSDFGFYVGGINEHFDIPQNKCYIIQNGIDRDFTGKFAGRVNKVYTKINLTFIGHAMDHHRLDILCAALHLIKEPELFRLHFVGANLESLKEKIPSSIEAVFHGVLNQDRIGELIKDFNIGLIPYALDYFSHVKVFMYGAAKLAVILPKAKNFRNIFTEDEVLFIENGSAEDLANKLNIMGEHPDIVQRYGENLYLKVANNFTWEKIYFDVFQKINDVVLSKDKNTSINYKCR